MSRRAFLRQTFWLAGALGTTPLLSACGSGPSALSRSAATSRFATLTELQPPDENGLRLPRGFMSRVVAVAGEPVGASGYVWHRFPDGGATFHTADGGWVYVSNSEVPAGGGAGALRFSADGEVADAYRILSLTSTNCAGGRTSWNTWLSCEETSQGQVYECDPFQLGQGQVRPALGRFAHEAVAVDPVQRMFYLTEDSSDGRFYRFVPSAQDWPATASRPQLTEGRLQVLRFAELSPDVVPREGFKLNRPRSVVWEDVVQPEQPQAAVRAGLTSPPGTPFRGGEGLWYHGGLVYFSTKGDHRIWCYDTDAQTLETIYDFAALPKSRRLLSGVDNLTVSDFGDVLVAEDGGDMQIVVILPDHSIRPLLQVTDAQGRYDSQSEITGPAFSPDGRHLYFSAQRSGRLGARGLGITFEVSLPFSACPGRSCP